MHAKSTRPPLIYIGNAAANIKTAAYYWNPTFIATTAAMHQGRDMSHQTEYVVLTASQRNRTFKYAHLYTILSMSNYWYKISIF